tara:strand:+ start:98 stop:229 length:132 start_codon:yes stop_codon:yes gene_type:complete
MPSGLERKKRFRATLNLKKRKSTIRVLFLFYHDMAYCGMFDEV